MNCCYIIVLLLVTLIVSGCKWNEQQFKDYQKKENTIMTTSKGNYAAFDRPEILLFLFHPRKEMGGASFPPTVKELIIPVDTNIHVGGRFYEAGKTAVNVLFFHGNGEIVEDYDDLAPLFNQIGINFIPVDYRGYGKSNGNPSVSSMMKDCHSILNYVLGHIKEHGYTGPVVIMGRSLGSASALELAHKHPDAIDGLIVESGFAYALPLLRLLGLNISGMGLKEEEGFMNIDKIRTYHKPTLIIHSQYDQIIPISDGKELFEASTAKEKRFLMIPNADHNTIFMYGMKEYLHAVKDFIGKVKK